MEGVCGDVQEEQVTLFTVNSPPPVGWVRRLASKCSLVAKHLVQVLALRLKSQRVCLLTTMHIEGQQNAISDIPFRLFGSNPAWKCDTDDELLTLFNCTFPLPCWQLWMVFHPNFTLVTHVILALRMTPDAFCSGRLETTSQGSKTRWQNWCAYVKPTGVNPYLQHTPFQTRVRCLTGFAARTQTGYYGRGGQVQSSTVTSAITAIGQTIALACNCNSNPTNVMGSKKFIPALQVMIDGYTKQDPPTKKMLPVASFVQV
jgi:hypothetical protein